MAVWQLLITILTLCALAMPIAVHAAALGDMPDGASALSASVLAQTDAGPPAVQAPDGTVTIDGWALQPLDLGGAMVYVQGDVPPELVNRMTNSIQRALPLVSALLDAPALPRLDFYLFNSQAEFERALRELAGVPANEISGSNSGYSWGVGPHPGTYYNAAVQNEDGRALWAVAHELTHQVERQLVRGHAIPQWFNEGVADLVASAVVRDLEPAYFGQRDFISRAQVANAMQVGGLPPLAPLVRNVQWTAAAAGSSSVVYQSARLALEQVVGDRGLASLGQVLTAVGQESLFDAAFTETFGLPSSEVDNVLAAYVSGTLAARFPAGLGGDRATLPSTERIQLVALGLKPSEQATWRFTGPGNCRGEGHTTAGATGFAAYGFWLRESSQSSCVGAWRVEVAGDQGSSRSYTFTFTRP